MKIFSKFIDIFKSKKELISLLFGLGLYALLSMAFNIPCPIKYISGVSCPGCGMTRALMAFFTFDFAAAYYYHPLVFLLIPFIAVLCVLSAKRMYKARKYLFVAAAVLLIVVYFYRFLVTKSPVLVFEPEHGFFPETFSKIFGN